jgi:hypothetical protein
VAARSNLDLEQDPKAIVGLSWQVVWIGLPKLLSNKASTRAQRAMAP